MDTRLIECFVAVARLGSFTRAAEELAMPQPHLSRLIQRLEDIVGASLFDRSSRQIALTPAGSALLAESRALLDQVSLALRRTAAATSAPMPVLRIGYTVLYPDLPLHHGILKFRERNPDVTLEFCNIGDAADQANRLRSGELDVGLFQFINCETAGLSWKRISRLTFVLAVPEHWPFPSDEPVDLARLADYPFVLSDPSFSPEIHDAQMAYCEGVGFRPKLARYGRERAELMLLVASGFGACFLFEPALRIRLDGVRQLVIANPREDIAADCNIVWLGQRPSPPTLDFVECLSEEMRLPATVRSVDRFDIEWRRTRA
ncbi:LysR family transcriptional regulator [soil metagenome]